MLSTLQCWPPELSEEQRAQLIKLATTYSLANSLAYLPNPAPSGPPTAAIHAPFTLIPTPYPRDLFHKAQKLQHIYNVLYSRITLDTPFLDRIMGAEAGVGKVDEFMGSLWKGWKAIRDNNGGKDVQPIHLGLFRSDYLIHQPSPESSDLSIKQVEFNTISSSFGALSEKTAALHRYLFAITGYYGAASCLTAENFPPNQAASGLARGMVTAHQTYGSPSASILFVVQPRERNVFDQRLLEYELVERHGIHVVRQTFDELHNNAAVSSDGLLTIKVFGRPQPVEISVVYYRAGYTPTDYPTPQQFDVRFELERSRAIKCPSIPMQLAGAKKVQQVLTNPGVLEAFLQDPRRGKAFSNEELAELRESWVGMWGLDEPDAVTRARDHYSQLVLKPQREGGGNNVYKSSIPAFLDTLPDREREAWIAMELITPPDGSKNWLLKAGEDQAGLKDVVSELGIFGWAVFGDDSPMQEDAAGWLVRTKGKDSDEGGVAVGFSVLDSIVLV
ncbi:hypothetical protein FRC04_008778 [Tulasnella sp. 424]|nr:hypothetical protein FRC04_008778 [Tulasnella sp. 424]KAG8980007.1 hypothetical protein FRC05_007450 [Tulasnella sp. 425]